MLNYGIDLSTIYSFINRRKPFISVAPFFSILARVFAEKIAQPLNNIDSVKIIDSGNGQGVPSFGKSITRTMVDMQEPLKEMTGIDVAQLLKSYVSRSNGNQNQGVPTVTATETSDNSKVEDVTIDDDLKSMGS
ncbi:hypothetical protein [Metabacillus elymi]|uniref:hypothetical protein n=1 Tax=Metabacillus elymi TaxID=2745198 RepID=UPI0021AB8558|nr:hypothetical protein [Metabacillus sp. KUDC1714]